MAVKVNKMADLKPLIFKDFFKVYEEKGKKLANKIEKEAKSLLQETFTDTHTGFRKAVVKTKTKKVLTTSKGIEIQVHFFVADAGTSDPHFVWHVVNRGRKTYTLEKNIAFKPRRKTRSRKMRLSLESYPGEEGGTVFMRSGSELKGFEGRQFYQTAMLQLLVKVFTKTEFSGWDVTNKEVNNG